MGELSLSTALQIATTGLTANRLWIDVIANNIANANTTKTATGEPYRRKVPVFRQILNNVMDIEDDSFGEETIFVDKQSGVEKSFLDRGVQAISISEDRETPFKVVSNPGHPDADEKGFVKMPNVNIIQEMVNMISANRAYDMNVQIINNAKAMWQRALEIGK